MTTIRILPEILSNQIAAGEVVQRPSNAVKELVENSIDAGADSITIEIERGGKSLIRISDNGCGLSRDDALLAIERYATSKIFSKEDLFSISTMGFRGEALPSIASVSKFTLVTRPADSDTATRIEIAGGKLKDVSDAGAPAGTMVEVRHLFYNTPARKKFLKSDNTEISHISDAVCGMALGNPHIRLRLFVNGRLQKSFSENDDLFQRSMTVLGKVLARQLYKLDYADDMVRIIGYAASPMTTRSVSSKIFLFVNNRLVYDRGLISAVFQGYRGRIMKGRFPMGAFFIQIGFDQVDVNVHPSKREIKFFNASRVYQAMARAVREAMESAQENASVYSNVPAPGNTRPQAAGESMDRPAKQIEDFAFFDKTFSSDKREKIEEPSLDFSPSKRALTIDSSAGEVPAHPVPGRSPSEPETEAEPAAGPDVRIIGQAMGTYILAETGEGLMLIDQHAAHERIIYEKLNKRYQLLKGQGQSLAVPETIELSYKEADCLNGFLDELKGLGVNVEPFGGNTFIIKSVPPIMDTKEIRPFILDIIEKKLAMQGRASSTEWLEESLILMACHSAIRANHSLSRLEMENLMRDLETCENKRHCPHGRPIMVFWDRNQIEKLFKRVV